MKLSVALLGAFAPVVMGLSATPIARRGGVSLPSRVHLTSRAGKASAVLMAGDSGDGRAAALALGAAVLLGGAGDAHAARSGGRMGGSVSRGGGYSRGGGGGGYGGGYRGNTNVIVTPGYSPFGFSPFGFGSPFGFSPFGFGGGLFFSPPSWLLLAGLGLILFRSSRESLEMGGGAAMGRSPGAALLLQVGLNCRTRSGSSMFGKMEQLAATADTSTDVGLQLLVSDTCLALLRSSNEWVSARTAGETAGMLGRADTEGGYRRLLMTERSKWEQEARRGGSGGAGGGPTYMVVTVMALLESGSPLPEISSTADLRAALSQLAGEVGKEDNLIAADVLWTPQDASDTLSQDDMLVYFPELVDI